MVVEDGIQGKGHRENIFNTDYKVMGCYTGDHKIYGNMTVINYAGGFSEEEENLFGLEVQNFLEK